VTRFDHILFPVDFSVQCVQMTPYVAAVAKTFNSNLTLLHVIDASDPFGYRALSSIRTYGTDPAELQQQNDNEITRFADSAFSGLCVNRVLEFGKPGPEITRYASEQNVDLVLMPTHGYGGFRRLLLGSVTSAVLHEARCPVWTATHTEQFCASRSQNVARIVCGIDLSPSSTALVRIACELGNQYGATVRLVHAVGSDLLGDDAPFQRFLLDTAKHQLAELQVAAQTHLESYVWPGSTAEVMRRAAFEAGAQLVIVGRGHARSPLGGLRTDLHAIIRESPCPVLSI
jgi:nucleotide-binding universal stress UspA family protein